MCQRWNSKASCDKTTDLVRLRFCEYLKEYLGNFCEHWEQRTKNKGHFSILIPTNLFHLKPNWKAGGKSGNPRSHLSRAWTNWCYFVDEKLVTRICYYFPTLAIRHFFTCLVCDKNNIATGSSIGIMILFYQQKSIMRMNVSIGPSRRFKRLCELFQSVLLSTSRGPPTTRRISSDLASNSSSSSYNSIDRMSPTPSNDDVSVKILRSLSALI